LGTDVIQTGTVDEEINTRDNIQKPRSIQGFRIVPNEYSDELTLERSTRAAVALPPNADF
jgi:hypothetical protein